MRNVVSGLPNYQARALGGEADCAQLTRLHRRVFPAEVVARTIFAANRVERYFVNLTAFPDLQPHHVLWGIWESDILLGYVHARALPQAWHLNYIVVAPEAQGQQIGNKLWEWWVAQGRARGYNHFSLDVEQANTRAVDWYKRKGLAVTHVTQVYELALPTTFSTTQQFYLEDWEAAEAWQNWYGFSQFRLVYDQHPWVVGRLGEGYFRLNELAPDAVLASLARLDPNRRIWAFSATDLPTASARIYRMEGQF